MSASRGGGECSSSSGNGGEDCEYRPLKKARYAWQVKGKCRAREDEASSSGGPEPAPASAQQNLEVLGGYVLRRDSTEAPASLVSCARQAEEDSYLKNWQSRQMAMGNVDNTINCVLESWGTPQQRMSVFHPFEFRIDDGELPASPSVENEGILMAISAHGLQHTSVPPAGPESSDGDHENYTVISDSDYSDSENYTVITDSEASNSATIAEDLKTSLAEPEHAHIIEEAIALAIQNKGLCWGYDYHSDVIIDNRSRD